MDGPDVIRWLIQLGVLFDLADDRPIGGNLLRKKPGGASVAGSFPTATTPASK